MTMKTTKTTPQGEIIDSQTGLRIGVYSTLQRARNKADKLDNDYGAYRYRARELKI